MREEELKPIIEALIYVTEDPVSVNDLVELLGKEYKESIRSVVYQLIQQFQSQEHGIEIKEIAGGLKMATKPEHHECVRKMIKRQTPAIKLSLPALETLAVVAYRQPVTLPEIQEVRGVNAGAVVKTLAEKRLVTTAGRKNVIGRPILYKTTKEFLIHFGLKDLHDLPSLEEFEELAQAGFGEEAIHTSGGEEAIVSDELVGDTSTSRALDEAKDPDKEALPEDAVSAEKRNFGGERPESFPTDGRREADGLELESPTTAPNRDSNGSSSGSSKTTSPPYPSSDLAKA